MKRISVLTIATMTALTIVASSTLSPAFAGEAGTPGGGRHLFGSRRRCPARP